MKSYRKLLHTISYSVQITNKMIKFTRQLLILLHVAGILSITQSCIPPQTAISPVTKPKIQASATVTPIFVGQLDLDCSRSRFDVAVVNHPSFCAVWVDNFDDESGFLVNLTYPNSGEAFAYRVEANITQLVFPEKDIPSTISQEECRKRQVFEIRVSALFDSDSVEIGRISGQGECHS